MGGASEEYNILDMSRYSDNLLTFWYVKNHPEERRRKISNQIIPYTKRLETEEKGGKVGMLFDNWVQ